MPRLTSYQKLRQAIRDLFPKRQEVRQALGQMTVVVNWIQTIEIWIDQLSSSQSATVDILAKGTVKEEYDQWTEDYTRQARCFPSWTVLEALGRTKTLVMIFRLILGRFCQ
ncbi:hypothetical protein KHU50_009525 [Colletotrichum sp. SAR 10_65]|nr:hypothetical protein KHU50_009525 [Colletotrichum sp. SAR 10_65]